MADFTVVPANVFPSTKAQLEIGTAGAAIAEGECVARDTDLSIKLHDANGAAPLNKFLGVAVGAATGVGKPIVYAKRDPLFKPGFAVSVGLAVITSANPGKMAPDADKASGWFVTELGRGVSTTEMNLAPAAVGIAIP